MIRGRTNRNAEPRSVRGKTEPTQTLNGRFRPQSYAIELGWYSDEPFGQSTGRRGRCRRCRRTCSDVIHPSLINNLFMSDFIASLFQSSKRKRKTTKHNKQAFLQVVLAASKTQAPACFDGGMLISRRVSGCSFRKRGEPN